MYCKANIDRFFLFYYRINIYFHLTIRTFFHKHFRYQPRVSGICDKYTLTGSALSLDHDEVKTISCSSIWRMTCFLWFYILPKEWILLFCTFWNVSMMLSRVWHTNIKKKNQLTHLIKVNKPFKHSYFIAKLADQIFCYNYIVCIDFSTIDIARFNVYISKPT